MGAGERFTAKRVSLGRTIDDIATELRISRKYILGIEEGDFKGFPARVFSVGFIKAYAAYLELDPEPQIQEYLDLLSEPSGSDPLHPVAVSPQWVEKARERGNRMVHYLAAAFVVLLLGTVLSWYVTRSARQPVVPSPTVSRPPVPVAPAHQPDNTVRAASPAADNGVPIKPADVVPAAPSLDNSIESASAGDTPPYQLYLEASDQTWLMYSMDDADPLDTMLYPGDKLSIQARRKIFLKLGNAGGVVGTLNGRRLPPFGGRGQVKVLTLGK